MDTSVLYHSDGTCDYISHIPIVAIEAELKVLELYDIPFVLHDEKTKDKTKVCETKKPETMRTISK